MKLSAGKKWPWWEWLPLLLLIPAYFLNLGLMPLWADEPIRALVALEMDLSGNYLAPTLMSEWYLNKPPLYNWILLGFYKVFGVSEFVTRLPAMLSLLGMCGIVYWAFKPEAGHRAALAAGLTYVTFGRMVWYSSHLGHIDPLYADLVFFNLIWIYRQFRDKRYWALFLVSYFLTSLGFLMKGLPTLAFQALTLLVVFIHGRQFRRLFNPAHIAGVLLFALMTGAYYWAYFALNISPQEYWENLLHENVKRTAVDRGFLNTFLHLFRFPLDQLFLYLPFSLFVPFLFSKQLWKTWWNDPFFRFTILVVAVNIPIYWLSPGVRPRYLFMLYPFIFLWIYLGYAKRKSIRTTYSRIFHGFLNIMILVLGLGIWVALGFQPDPEDSFFPVKIACISGSWLGLAWAYYKLPEARYFLLFSTLLIFKICVQWVVLPHRYFEDGHREYRQMAVSAGIMTDGEELYIGDETPISPATAFYITLARNRQFERIPRRQVGDRIGSGAGGWLIWDGRDFVPEGLDVKYVFLDPWRNYPLLLGKITAD